MFRILDARKALASFRGDEEGVITIEFVIYMPLLMLWIAFSFLFFDAFRTNSQTEKVAYTMADIMSRHEAVDDVDMAYLVGLQSKMLPQRLDMRATRISSICFEDGFYKVMWSYSEADEGVAGYEQLTDDTIPLDIMPTMGDQDSVILTEVRARWTPITGIGGLKSQVWTNALVSGPRFVRIIPHTSLNPSTICPLNVDGSTPGGT